MLKIVPFTETTEVYQPEEVPLSTDSGFTVQNVDSPLSESPLFWSLVILLPLLTLIAYCLLGALHFVRSRRERQRDLREDDSEEDSDGDSDEDREGEHSEQYSSAAENDVDEDEREDSEDSSEESDEDAKQEMEVDH